MSDLTELSDQLRAIVDRKHFELTDVILAEAIIIGRNAERYRIGLELKKQAEESNVVRLAAIK